MIYANILSNTYTQIEKKKTDFLVLLEKPFFTFFSRSLAIINNFDCNIEDQFLRNERNEIFKIILTEKYKAVFNNSLWLINQVIENDINSISFANSCTAMIQNTVLEYERNIYFSLQRRYKEYSQDIYNIVYDGKKKKTFKPAHEKRIASIYELVEMQQMGNSFDMVYKLSTFLDNCHVSTKNACFEMQKVIIKLNGELTSVLEKYKQKYVTKQSPVV